MGLGQGTTTPLPPTYLQVRRLRLNRITSGWVDRMQSETRTNDTAFMLASSSGHSQLYKSGALLSWRRWSPATTPVAPWCTDKRLRLTSDLLVAQPELEEFPRHLLEHFEMLAAQPQTLGVAVPDFIRVVKAGVLSAEVPWLDAGLSELQTVHACPHAWGKPWFDSISCVGGDDDGAPWFARLRLLFWAGSRQLAFVRWYLERPDATGDPDLLAQFGCTRLQWETVREGRLMRPRYGILELDQIRAREYVVPDFSEKEDGYFHASIFKWHRGSPDKEMFSTNGAPLTDDDSSDEERE